MNDIDRSANPSEPFVSQESDESDGFLPGTVNYMTMDNSEWYVEYMKYIPYNLLSMICVFPIIIIDYIGVWSLYSYFMGWFHDTNTENEHLHLKFPGREGDYNFDNTFPLISIW